MKKKIAALTLALGMLLSVTIPTMAQDYVDMNAIVSYEVTETGILFHFEDGTGYYLDRMEVESR